MQVDIERHDAIKRQLRARHVIFVGIAKELGITQVAVTRVCQGHARSNRVEEAIAHKLDVTAASLWPDRYKEER
ncbi:helix-turn-helix domain-containing protein [Agrobacterium rosae]|uniref:helix-turn-helix domain-containing protein n=1 Tax=Agrobacterium rosae TaxID=1972867 RepID=UPI0019D3C708|nr:helix-turn-helix domain-containing protein [Agrobacterium rosae]MBN7806461.1 helix-turn-helix domain-containing protein [Agrobacterium rosae]MBN7806596.1 helix-turn-helix domain-containing protein [Agrobacterium rosae]